MGYKKGKPITDEVRAEILRLASTGCTMEDMAILTGVYPTHIKAHCKYEIKLGQARHRQAIREGQLTSVSKHPLTAIFLGKQYLGQQDQVRTPMQFSTLDNDEQVKRYKAKVERLIGPMAEQEQEPQEQPAEQPALTTEQLHEQVAERIRKNTASYGRSGHSLDGHRYVPKKRATAAA